MKMIDSFIIRAGLILCGDWIDEWYKEKANDQEGKKRKKEKT